MVILKHNLIYILYIYICPQKIDFDRLDYSVIPPSLDNSHMASLRDNGEISIWRLLRIANKFHFSPKVVSFKRQLPKAIPERITRTKAALTQFSSFQKNKKKRIRYPFQFIHLHQGQVRIFLSNILIKIKNTWSLTGIFRLQ